MPFAIVAPDKDRGDAVLMVLEEEAEAEAIVVWLRLRHVWARVRTTEPERRQGAEVTHLRPARPWRRRPGTDAAAARRAG
jgi:hypothetical protein